MQIYRVNSERLMRRYERRHVLHHGLHRLDGREPQRAQLADGVLRDAPVAAAAETVAVQLNFVSWV